jgi:hypothetical protein
MSDMFSHNRVARPFDEQSEVTSEWSEEVAVATPAVVPEVPTVPVEPVVPLEEEKPAVPTTTKKEEVKEEVKEEPEEFN